MLIECLAGAVAALSVFGAVQTVRVRRFRQLLFPPDSPNVINGIIYPPPDDLRWTRDFDIPTRDYVLNELTVRREYEETFTIRIEEESTFEGSSVGAYWHAIDRAYQQHRAMKVIEGPDESVLALEALERKEKAAARRAARSRRKHRR